MKNLFDAMTEHLDSIDMATYGIVTLRTDVEIFLYRHCKELMAIECKITPAFWENNPRLSIPKITAEQVMEYLLDVPDQEDSR